MWNICDEVVQSRNKARKDLAYECQTYVWRESGCHNLSGTATAVGRMSRRTKDLHSFAIHNPTNQQKKAKLIGSYKHSCSCFGIG
eukprot:scaffold1022_cov196-Alexandrium_tamarense.AAC.14